MGQAQEMKKGNSQTIEQGVNSIPVALETFVRAETDKMFKSYAANGGFGKFIDQMYWHPLHVIQN